MAQDGGIRGGAFDGEMDRCRNVGAGLRHAVVCPNVRGRIKEKILTKASVLVLVRSP